MEERMAKQWFCGCPHQGKERLAKRELENQQFETYLPMVICDWAKKPRIGFFLPGYIFIALDPDNQRWRSIFSTYGMRTMLFSGDRPSPVPGWILEEIRAREVDGLVRLPPKVQSKHKHGDSVAIKGSPMQAVFDEVVDHRRAAVFLSLLGQTKRAIIQLNRLTAVQPSAAAC
jgi:transcriptional antiterminator RfaH